MAHRNEINNERFPGEERVAKAIARAGLASRRQAEQWIASGRVAVNGDIIHSPARNVTTRDRVSVDGVPLPTRERTRLFLFHKPRGQVTTHADPQGRPTIFQRLPGGLPRLISVGRLDFNTEGLLLLTNDGGLARVLELPATGWLRRYRVRAHGSVTQQGLEELQAGVTVNGIRYGRIDARLDRVQGTNLWLTFAIREGKNREVRHVLGHLGLVVTRLIRVSFGPFRLDELAAGALDEVRTRILREQLGEHLIALSGADFAAPVVPRPQPEPKKAQAAIRSAGPRPTNHKSIHHVWRVREEKDPPKRLQREFRGIRGEDHAPREQPAAARAGLLTDRKGRRVLVERKGSQGTSPEREPRKPRQRSLPHLSQPANAGAPKGRGARPQRGRKR